MTRRLLLGLLGAVLLVPGEVGRGATLPPAAERHRLSLRTPERPGLLIPMYVYPAGARQTAAYDRLLDLRRRYQTVPMWVIVNPASGPGRTADPNYTQTIDRLADAGCVLLGYVTTSYAKRSEAEVQADVNQWLNLYPRIHGIFFDEMIYEDTEAGARYQASLRQYAHRVGCWPTVANPGVSAPSRYFERRAADVIVVHENNTWPAEAQLKGDGAGGPADYPPFTRAVLVHSQPELDLKALRMARKYVQWLYVTEDPFRPNDATAANPWDRLSKHLDELCRQLVKSRAHPLTTGREGPFQGRQDAGRPARSFHREPEESSGWVRDAGPGHPHQEPQSVIVRSFLNVRQ